MKTSNSNHSAPYIASLKNTYANSVSQFNANADLLLSITNIATNRGYSQLKRFQKITDLYNSNKERLNEAESSYFMGLLDQAYIHVENSFEKGKEIKNAENVKSYIIDLRNKLEDQNKIIQLPSPRNSLLSRITRAAANIAIATGIYFTAVSCSEQTPQSNHDVKGARLESKLVDNSTNTPLLGPFPNSIINTNTPKSIYEEGKGRDPFKAPAPRVPTLPLTDTDQGLTIPLEEPVVARNLEDHPIENPAPYGMIETSISGGGDLSLRSTSKKFKLLHSPKASENYSAKSVKINHVKSFGNDLEVYRKHTLKEGSRHVSENFNKSVISLTDAGYEIASGVTFSYGTDEFAHLRKDDLTIKEPAKKFGNSFVNLFRRFGGPFTDKEAYEGVNPLVGVFTYPSRLVGASVTIGKEGFNTLTIGLGNNAIEPVLTGVASTIESGKHLAQSGLNNLRAPVLALHPDNVNHEPAQKTLDYLLLAPLELASNIVKGEGIENMEDPQHSVKTKGNTGTILESGLSLYLIAEGINDAIDQSSNNGKVNGGENGGPGVGNVTGGETGGPGVN